LALGRGGFFLFFFVYFFSNVTHKPFGYGPPQPTRQNNPDRTICSFLPYTPTLTYIFPCPTAGGTNNHRCTRGSWMGFSSGGQIDVFCPPLLFLVVRVNACPDVVLHSLFPNPPPNWVSLFRLVAFLAMVFLGGGPGACTTGAGFVQPSLQSLPGAGFNFLMVVFPPPPIPAFYILRDFYPLPTSSESPNPNPFSPSLLLLVGFGVLTHDPFFESTPHNNYAPDPPPLPPPFPSRAKTSTND